MTTADADADGPRSTDEATITVNLFMGLGNQLFQYAAGRALALETGAPLQVDVTSYGGVDGPGGGAVVRHYGVARWFAVDPPVITPEDRATYAFTQPVRRAWNKTAYRRRPLRTGLPYELPRPVVASYDLYRLLRPAHRQRMYWEPHFTYDPNFFAARAPVYLNGYWQSWRYLDRHREAIVAELQFRPEVRDPLEAVAAELREAPSVGVHVRLTDRLNPGYEHPTPDYYRRAVDAIRIHQPDATFHLFSDDPDRALGYLPADAHATVVSGQVSRSEGEDLFLLSSCRHVITGLSSFSWWAAQLQPRADRIVVSPSWWHRDGRRLDRDLIPPGWIALHP